MSAELLNEQLATTQSRLREAYFWLAQTMQALAVSNEALARAEADRDERLAALEAERARADSLAETLARNELDSQHRLAIYYAERARAEALVQALSRAELDSQNLQAALLRAEHARVRELHRRLAEFGLARPGLPDADDVAATVASGSDHATAARLLDAEGRGIVSARAHNVLTVIRPAGTSLRVGLRELWQFRYLFSALVRRNIRVEFDATRLGSIWGIIRPLVLAIVFATFRNFSNADTREGLPYVIWVYTGLLLWTYFTDAATNAAAAVRNDASLLTKVYYPRLLTPIVPIVAGLVTLGVGLVPIVGLMIWYGLHPGWPIVLLPILVLQCIFITLGLGTLVSSMSIENRDWERLFVFGLTVALWLSPVIYAPEMIPVEWRTYYMLNPMAGLMLAFRAVLFGGYPLPTWEWAYSWSVTVIVLVVGVWAFRRTEVRLMDRL